MPAIAAIGHRHQRVETCCSADLPVNTHLKTLEADLFTNKPSVVRPRSVQFTIKEKSTTDSSIPSLVPVVAIDVNNHLRHIKGISARSNQKPLTEHGLIPQIKRMAP